MLHISATKFRLLQSLENQRNSEFTEQIQSIDVHIFDDSERQISGECVYSAFAIMSDAR